MASLSDLGVSTAYIIGVCIFAQISRSLFRYMCPNNCSQIIMMGEWIAAVEMVLIYYERKLILSHFGVYIASAYGIVLLIWLKHVRGTATACPYICLEQYLDSVCCFTDILMLIPIQVIAGCSIYVLVELYWSLGLAEMHKGLNVRNCKTDLKVDILTGFLIEFGATLILRLTLRTIKSTKAQFGSLMYALTAVGLETLARPYTGAFMNPLSATALKYNCEGHNEFDHLMVYWLAPFLAAIVAKLIFSIFERSKYPNRGDENCDMQ